MGNRIVMFTIAIVVIGAITLGGAGADSGKTMHEGLSARDVGEYGGMPWAEPGKSMGSREDRVKDLNLSVAKVSAGQMKSGVSEEEMDKWARRAQAGRDQGKKLLLQLYFWDGMDRVEGPLHDIEVYWNRLDRFLSGMKSRGALENLLGICLAEENVAGEERSKMLTEPLPARQREI